MRKSAGSMKLGVEAPPYSPYLSYSLTERTVLRPRRGHICTQVKLRSLGLQVTGDPGG